MYDNAYVWVSCLVVQLFTASVWGLREPIFVLRPQWWREKCSRGTLRPGDAGREDWDLENRQGCLPSSHPAVEFESYEYLILGKITRLEAELDALKAQVASHSSHSSFASIPQAQ